MSRKGGPMSEMKDVRAMVRTDCVPRLARALQEAGAIRLYASEVHALGAGVDPEDYEVSANEGEAHTRKAEVEFLCPTESVDELLEVVRDCARTGHRGDGLIIVSDVTAVVNIRTGDRSRLALA